ncbi:zinc metallochaperone AztD [Mycolicibacterium hippocampi]|uniref:Putative secreted protein n=1 Tax=Mycolicibacterium hippocampi TaxID=659824 RepID=A0A850PRZ6_9MYCO|nr:zinc metallochaperone AztD [Mycolicibacterium hippocampi]NVN53342.1 putative secreted protein [Mycolicibacterium hippocampi]
MSKSRWLYRVGVASGAVVALAACSGGNDAESTQGAETTQESPARSAPVNEPLVATYDGGLYILDGETLEVQEDIPLEGFLRVNPAGDQSHVLVTTSDGFRILDAAGGQLTDDTFPADEAGHVVAHGERTVLFADGSGEIMAFDPHDLENGMPETENFTTPEAHHGVAVILGDGTLVHSIGDSENRTGAVAMQGDQEVARSEECPGIHGETVAADEVVVLGCEDGVLEYANGEFTKIASPTPYGRIGNTRGHEDSPVVLGDMKIDPDAELERPEQFSLIDTTTDQLRVVALPPSVSYWFRSLGRGPQGEALILGTDGKLYVFDPVTGDTVRSIQVTQPWSEPDDWQQPGPAVFTREDAVYVSDPAAKQIHLVDLQDGAVTASGSLEQTPNELSGAAGHDHH